MRRNLWWVGLIVAGVLGACGAWAQETGRVERLVPLDQMAATERYKGEDGGLYGGGKNEPPAGQRKAALGQIARIEPLDAQGKPSGGGKIVLLSMGMSNTTQEFTEFKKLADRDEARNPKVVIVDGALGGADAEAWVAEGMRERVWENVQKRLEAAGVTPEQVQVVWMKQALKGPARLGAFPRHAEVLRDDMVTGLNMAKERFPNLRIAYLSSRIYAGYASTPLNPEPYAYEGAFAVRWVIQSQMKGDAKLNWDETKGKVRAPVVLWGPYLWADGTNGRKSDKLVWNAEDFGPDGTHPSMSGRTKVAQLLLKFLKTDELAKGWFVGAGGGARSR